jgi:hypothetical protein
MNKLLVICDQEVKDHQTVGVDFLHPTTEFKHVFGINFFSANEFFKAWLKLNDIVLEYCIALDWLVFVFCEKMSIAGLEFGYPSRELTAATIIFELGYQSKQMGVLEVYLSQ